MQYHGAHMVRRDVGVHRAEPRLHPGRPNLSYSSLHFEHLINARALSPDMFPVLGNGIYRHMDLVRNLLLLIYAVATNLACHSSMLILLSCSPHPARRVRVGSALISLLLQTRFPEYTRAYGLWRRVSWYDFFTVSV